MCMADPSWMPPACAQRRQPPNGADGLWGVDLGLAGGAGPWAGLHVHYH